MYERMVAVTNHRLCRMPEGADQTEDGCFEPGTGLWESYLDQIRKIVSVKPRAVVLREKDLSPEIYRKLAEEVDQICREQDQMLILNTAPAVAAQLGMRKLHIEKGRETAGCRVCGNIHSLGGRGKRGCPAGRRLSVCRQYL